MFLKISLMITILIGQLACSRASYKGSIPVSQHLWKLQRIDTFFSHGAYRPAAYWYNTNDRLFYVDFDHEFPYPYILGTNLGNFDRD